MVLHCKRGASSGAAGYRPASIATALSPSPCIARPRPAMSMGLREARHLKGAATLSLRCLLEALMSMRWSTALAVVIGCTSPSVALAGPGGQGGDGGVPEAGGAG